MAIALGKISDKNHTLPKIYRPSITLKVVHVQAPLSRVVALAWLVASGVLRKAFELLRRCARWSDPPVFAKAPFMALAQHSIRTRRNPCVVYKVPEGSLWCLSAQ